MRRHSPEVTALWHLYKWPLTVCLQKAIHMWHNDQYADSWDYLEFARQALRQIAGVDSYAIELFSFSGNLSFNLSGTTQYFGQNRPFAHRKWACFSRGNFTSSTLITGLFSAIGLADTANELCWYRNHSDQIALCGGISVDPVLRIDR